MRLLKHFSSLKRNRWWLSIFAYFIYGVTAQAGEPALPVGLDPQIKPGTSISDPNKNKQQPTAERPPIFPAAVLTGFWETRAGVRTKKDVNENRASLAETRLRINLEIPTEQLEFRLSSDLLYDAIADRHDIDLEDGSGFLDLRAASLLMRPAPYLDIKLGRQTLTWGTGDLIFINDLFPKDFKSFFIGRDVQYLKAPSDALKFSLFSALAGLDLVYTPRFDADRFIDGSRLSFFNQNLGRLSGKQDVIGTTKPDDWFSDHEIALRMYRNLRGYELALYAYRGFWKSPAGTDRLSGKAIFPRLAVYGASIRGAVSGGGIGHLELGYYDSLDDRDGDDPTVRNSEFRLLTGYERELVKELSLGMQYYLEHRLDHESYKRTLPQDQPLADENRHVLTLRLTRLLKKQDLRLSLFTFYSPSNRDGYLRPVVTYRLDDDWLVEAGGNWFFGDTEHTFFGQFKNNSNIYMGVRYSFSI